MLAHVLEENRRLWLALEAAQQSEAVTNAALREALKATPKQLTAGEPSTPDTAIREATGEGARVSPSVVTDAPPASDGEMGTDEILALCRRIHAD